MLIWVVVLVLGGVPEGEAEESAGDHCPSRYLGRTVGAVEVRCDNPDADLVAISRCILTTEGGPLTRLDIRNTVRLIHALDIYDQIAVHVTPLPDEKVAVLYEVTHRILVRRVSFSGGYEILPLIGERGGVSLTTLRRTVPLRRGQPFSDRILAAGEDAIRGLFRARGFYLVQVHSEVTPVSPFYRDVLFRIELGEPTLVRAIRIEGEEHFSDRVPLRKARNKVGRRFDADRHQTDLERVRDDLQERPGRLARLTHRFVRKDRKFRLAEVSFGDPLYDEEDNRIEYAVSLDGGHYVTVRVKAPRNVRLFGKRFVSEGLFDQLPVFHHYSIDEDLIEEGRANLVDFYRKFHYHAPAVTVEQKTAPEDNRTTITYRVQEGPRLRVRAFHIRGNEQVSGGTIRKHTLSGRGLGRNRFFSAENYAADLRSVEKLYHDRGYLDATVRGAEPVFHERGVDLQLTVVEGPRHHPQSVRIETGAALQPDVALDLTTETFIQDKHLQADRAALVRWFRENGYKDARVKTRLTDTAEPGTKEVVYVLERPQRHVVGRILITGLGRTRRSVVERELELKTGEAYQYAKLLESQRKLYGLGIFESVSITPVPRPKTPGILDIKVRVREGQVGLVETGLGYFQEQGISGVFIFSYGNLGGRDRTLSTLMRFSDLKNRQEITYQEPWLGNSPFRAALTLFREDVYESAYRAKSHGALLTVSRWFRLRYKLVFGHRWEQVYLSRVIEIPGKFNTKDLSSTFIHFIFDSRDNVFDPHKGFLAGLRLESASKTLGSEQEYWKTHGQVACYLPLDRRTLVFSTRLGWGENLPLVEKFEVGTTVLRGFTKNEVGPHVVSVDGAALEYLGGDLMAAANLELRIPLEKWLAMALFVDTGTAFRRKEDLGLAEFRSNVGAGLILLTPFGPLRVDYGYKLDRRERESAGQFSFSLGHVF
jgi:outer membrane protein insertion porin family